MPKVGETWLTRYGLKVRIIADDAKGPYPLVGLVDWPPADREKAWTFSTAGLNCDPCDDALDLIAQHHPMAPRVDFAAYDDAMAGP